jgi:hypothetical protein
MNGQNYLRRIHEVTRAVRSCREASTLRRAFLKCKLRRNQGRRIQVSQGHWIARERRVSKRRVDQSRTSGEDRWHRSRDIANSELHEVRAQRLGTLGCQRRSPERARSSIVGPCSRRVKIRQFDA